VLDARHANANVNRETLYRSGSLYESNKCLMR
jgi:hypothetical protein